MPPLLQTCQNVRPGRGYFNARTVRETVYNRRGEYEGEGDYKWDRGWTGTKGGEVETNRWGITTLPYYKGRKPVKVKTMLRT